MNYLIIGNSSAAIGAVEGIRQVDSTNPITIISDEPHHTYGRPLISYWLEGKLSDEKMFYRPQNFYEKNNCKLLLGTKVTAIDIEAQVVQLQDTSFIEYDKLLIATGSRPLMPPVPGLEQVKNKFSFMTYDDAKAIKAILKPDSKVLIIGAGLIGLKAAEGITKTTSDITVVDLADRILPSILDSEAAQIIQKHMEQKDIRFILNNRVDSFSSDTATLSSGETLDFDLVIVAVGVRPNVELAKEAGLAVNRGILLDESCKTSDANIYAAGDCTESMDITTGEQKILALLPNAYMQGEVAGICMAGGQKTYTHAIPMNAIGFFGLHMITAGTYDGEAVVTHSNESFKKLVFKDNVLKGYMMIGDVKRAGIYTSLIKEQVSVSKLDLELLHSKPQMMLFDKARRLEKLGGVHNEN
ncbi:FAD-dependent oxidoreductase [Sporanaerobium hydrogeniformans]|uniref:FAD-dependent oxidoreductase n=1 Tax=Sporanaerobium hydrogeniformans TaxID=3072179 RepID=A0AC61DCU4_9FIRM|nr:FAD-dependent oxidoreductase [Sporanaerobium hydrogeniformans]PHV70586.1 FAD-dependent oxidoreductase [Sporanaerobium hydrogeniformans]